MNVTHAKLANPREVNRKNVTKNFGLKHPCECNSGKKFKHCCFGTPSRGWGWVRLYQDNWSMVVFPVNESTVPQADADMHGAHLVPVYSTYEKGTAAAAKLPAAKPTWLVRMQIEELEQHILKQFPAATRVVMAVQSDVSPSGDGELRLVTVPGQAPPSMDEVMANLGAVVAADEQEAAEKTAVADDDVLPADDEAMKWPRVEVPGHASDDEELAHG